MDRLEVVIGVGVVTTTTSLLIIGTVGDLVWRSIGWADSFGADTAAGVVEDAASSKVEGGASNRIDTAGSWGALSKLSLFRDITDGGGLVISGAMIIG
jgi:hypothetical protein